MNRHGPHRLMHLNEWITVSGTNIRCGLVGDVALWGQALRSQILKLGLVWHTVSFCCL